MNVGDVCQLAAGKFQEAADLYGKAIMGVAPNLKWAYQAQKAGALAGLARFTSQADKRADAIKQATDLLAEALLRRENSPYLQETVRLKNELGRINESPLAPPSTGAPAAPTPASAPATTPS